MDKEKDLSEQFTLQGFFMVSALALLFSFQVVPVVFLLAKEIESFEINSTWNTIVSTYAIVWFFCFLFFCLIPKLKGEK